MKSLEKKSGALKKIDGAHLTLYPEPTLYFEEDEADSKLDRIMTFVPVIFVVATLPHSKVTSNRFERENGNYKLTLIGAREEIGLPYGSLSRFILLDWATKAVQNQSAVIELGTSISDYVRYLGYPPTGGKYGYLTTVRDHIKKLANTFISFNQFLGGTSRGEITNNIPIINKLVDYFVGIKEDERTLWPTQIELNEKIFASIIDHSVPVDLVALKKLSGSALDMDLYCWGTHRNARHSNGRVVKIPYDKFQKQFGANYSFDAEGTAKFKYNLKKSIKNVKMVYEDFDIRCETKYVEFHPTRPHIEKIPGSYKILT